MQKEYQSAMLDKHFQENKRMLQNTLANDYNNASRRRQMNHINERQNEISADRATINRVKHEMDYLNTAESKKKQYVQQMFRNEKKLYEITKANEQRKHEMEQREDQGLLNENVRKSYDREAQFKSRYNSFHKFQNQVADSYQKNVLSPEIEKNSRFDSIVKKQVDERNKRIDDMERHKQTFYKNWNQNTKNVIVNQMSHHKDRLRDEQDKLQFERRERNMKQNEIAMADYLENQQRKDMQSKYREMLDNQRKIKAEYKAYGNMTDVEKSMNRNDLIAWKNYDYTTYAMIPGFNSSTLNLSQKVEEARSKKQKVRDLEKETQRLNIYKNSLNRVQNDLALQDYMANPSAFKTLDRTNSPNQKIHVPTLERSIQSNSDSK